MYIPSTGQMLYFRVCILRGVLKGVKLSGITIEFIRDNFRVQKFTPSVNMHLFSLVSIITKQAKQGKAINTGH